MPSDYKAVIFDLDGTLIDSMGIWRQVDEDFLGKRNIPVPQDLFDHLPQGNSYIQTAQYFKDRFSLTDSVEDIMNEWTNAVHLHYEKDIALKQDADTVIKWLAEEGISIAMGTSNSLDLALAALKQHHLTAHFKAIVTGCRELKGKPFPDIYLACSNELSILPQDCIVIEDTLSGVRAAKAAGMYVIAIYDEDSAPLWSQICQEANHYAYDYANIHLHLRQLLDR